MELGSRYELLEKIGTGSFATVYRARDQELGREVAVKQIHDQFLADDEQLDKFWSEAQLLASFQHPNIVTIYDLYRERGWLIIELMQTNLSDRMSGRPMDVRALKTTIAHCLRALTHLHERGIVHGDVKPANMMIDARRRVKLGDFGLARRASDDEGSLLKGTTKYMAPEVVSDEFGDVGPASDLYSLGFSAYELMCGKNFESLFPGLSAYGRNKQVAWMMWHAAPDRRLPEIARVLEGVPEDLAHVLQTLCEKDQSKRYKSAEEALADLNVDQKIIKATDHGAEESDKTADPEAAARKKRLMLIGGAFLMSMALSLAMLWPESDEGGGQQSVNTVWVVDSIIDDDTIAVFDIERSKKQKLEFGPNPAIRLENDDAPIMVSELKPGDRLEVQIEKQSDGSIRKRYIAARPVVTHGRIKEIDIRQLQLIIAPLEGAVRDDLPIRVPKGLAVQLNAKAHKFADLQIGDTIDVTHLSAPRGKSGRIAQKISALRLLSSVGFVKEYDTVQRVLSIRYGSGPAEFVKFELKGEWKFPVAKDCDIKSDGRPLKPTDLRPDQRVRFRRDVEFREIQVTRGKMRMKGIVRGISLVEVEISTADGKKFTVRPAEDCDITLNQKSITKLSDLKEYDYVEITYEESGDGQLAAFTIDASRNTNRKS